MAPVEQGGSRVACYGVLRGCMAAMQAADEFFYIDHAYFASSRPFSGAAMFDGTWQFGVKGHYRVVRNGFWHSCAESNEDDTRLKDLGVTLKDWRTKGDHIVIVPPSEYSEVYHDRRGWLDDTLKRLALHTDRAHIVHTKHDAVPLKEVLKGAWCLVTDHSNAAIDALTEGVPAIMTHPARRLGCIGEIENPPMRRDFFAHLANNQWSLAEMAAGENWKRDD